MKKLLFTLTIIILYSCSQTINYDENREYFEKRQGIMYYQGSPFSGTLIQTKYSYFGEPWTEKTTYKDGKKDGLFEEYHPNGELKLQKMYKNGRFIKKLE